MAGYAKLWSGITESSLWGSPKDARLLFITMLARADSIGFVESSESGLARMANLTPEETVNALAVLTSPDPGSKSPVAEGRRVAVVPGGFCVVNYEAYRARRDDEERREYMRKYMQSYRKGTEPVNSSKQAVNQSKPCKAPLAKAEAEAEAEAEEEKEKTLAPQAAARTTLLLQPQEPKPRKPKAPKPAADPNKLPRWSIGTMLRVLEEHGGGRFIVLPYDDGLNKPLNAVIGRLADSGVTLDDIAHAARWVRDGGERWMTDGIPLTMLCKTGYLSGVIGKAILAARGAA